MNADQQILTQLAKEYREVAFAPVNEERRALWKALNGLRECRPLIMMDQLPWHELDVDGDLKLRCRDADARIVEDALRKQLYQAKYFPADKVFEPYLELPKTIEGYHHGVVRREVTLAADEKNDVVSHSYVSQLSSESDLENLKFPDIRVDEAKDKKRWEKVSEMVSGILPVRLTGVRMFHCGIWDDLVEAIGTDSFFFFFADEPELLHKAARRMVDICQSLIDQLTEKQLFDAYEPTVHCTGAYTDELPQDKEKNVRPGDVWTFGLAQMLGSVSPQMFEEYEVEYVKPLLEQFGLVYYGCCEPLHNRIDYIRKIKNVRKISMSPWADIRAGAEHIHGDYVISRKPNPAYLAAASFDPELVRRELQETCRAAKENGCTCELILKDVSTVQYHPERLAQWHKIAVEVAGEW